MVAVTVSKDKLLSAAEIAEARLPGLPTTKANVLARAEKEGWYVEERAGLGGQRKVFRLPERYLPSSAVLEAVVASRGPVTDPSKGSRGLLQAASDYVAEARDQGKMSDGDLIQEIVVGVERWLERNNVQPDVEKKAALISLLFRYFQSDGTLDEAKLDKLLKAVA